MGQRNVYVPDNLQALLENESRLDANNSQGRLIVALARAALLGLEPPPTVAGDVLRSLPDDVPVPMDVLAGALELPIRVVSQTLDLLLAIEPPVVTIDPQGRWSRVSVGGEQT